MKSAKHYNRILQLQVETICHISTTLEQRFQSRVCKANKSNILRLDLDRRTLRHSSTLRHVQWCARSWQLCWLVSQFPLGYDPFNVLSTGSSLPLMKTWRIPWSISWVFMVAIVTAGLRWWRSTSDFFRSIHWRKTSWRYLSLSANLLAWFYVLRPVPNQT